MLSFECESPEREFTRRLDLGALTGLTWVTAESGGYKSTMAQALVCTIGGAPQSKASNGYRNHFDSLIWLGEGASCVYRYGDKEKRLLLYPYDAEGKPNHMEYAGDPTPVRVSYLANLGDVLLTKNARPSSKELQAIDAIFEVKAAKYGWKYTAKEVRSQFNIVVPSAMTHATCLLGIIQAVCMSDVVVGDFLNPGLSDHLFKDYLQFAQDLALEKGVKLIFFFPRTYPHRRWLSCHVTGISRG